MTCGAGKVGDLVHALPAFTCRVRERRLEADKAGRSASVEVEVESKRERERASAGSLQELQVDIPEVVEG